MKILNYYELDSIADRVLTISLSVYPELYVVYDTLYRTGLRPSELIDLSRFIDVGGGLYSFLPNKKNNVRMFNRNQFNSFLLPFLGGVGSSYNPFSVRYLSRFFGVYSGVRLNCLNKPISTYLFRHLFVKKMVINGASSADVQAVIGHTNISSTLSYINSVIFM